MKTCDTMLKLIAIYIIAACYEQSSSSLFVHKQTNFGVAANSFTLNSTHTEGMVEATMNGKKQEERVDDEELITVADFEKRAVTRMDESTRGYIMRGAGNDVTFRRNTDAFQDLVIIPRTFAGHKTHPDISTRFTLVKRNTSEGVNAMPLLEQHYEFKLPIGISPFALHGLAHAGGEVTTVKAASRAGVPMIVPMLSSKSLEDVAAAASPGTTLWFQFYWLVSFESTLKLIRRAEAAGYRAIVLTADVTNIGKPRHGADIRNQPGGISFPNFAGDDYIKGLLNGAGSVDERVSSIFYPGIDWSHLKRLTKLTPLPVIVKGILNAQDALKAVENGASGVFVSNSGGRCLDGSPATIEVLLGITDSIRHANPDCLIFIDSGIRSGDDAFKAFARGAHMVFVGRPIIYGLVVNGSDGAVDVLSIFRRELEQKMQFAGVNTIGELRAKGLELVNCKNFVSNEYDDIKRRRPQPSGPPSRSTPPSNPSRPSPPLPPPSDPFTHEDPVPVDPLQRLNINESETHADANGLNSNAKGLYPDANGFYPNEKGKYPDANGRYPNPQGLYPDSNGQYPDENGHYPGASRVLLMQLLTRAARPDERGRYTNANGFYADANGRFPDASGLYPDANGLYPDANRRYPNAECGQYPDANGNYPSCNAPRGTSTLNKAKPDELGPNAKGRFPNSNGLYADANGKYPDANGQYADANGRYPDANGFYPDSEGRYP